MSDPVPTPPINLPGQPMVDCTPEGIADRNRRLAELMATFSSGVSQVVDRNRSVTFRSMGDIEAALRALRAEAWYCTYGAWPSGPRRVYYIPQVKDL